jgi:hypothetical protein
MAKEDKTEDKLTQLLQRRQRLEHKKHVEQVDVRTEQMEARTEGHQPRHLRSFSSDDNGRGI